MMTPWGALDTLDLTDVALAEEILSADKHQLLEGLVVESLFDQVLSRLPSGTAEVVPLDVETVIADPGNGEPFIAIVWARSRTNGLGRYLMALQQQFQTYLFEHEPATGFTGSQMIGGHRSAPPAALHDVLAAISVRQPRAFSVDKSVRDASRQRSSVWGFLVAHYGDRLAPQVILPRLLINCGVQPWFRGVWNLDRIFLVDGRPWLFEVKHKFPFGQSRLKFGLNTGEVNVFSRLSQCGIDTLFSIMVKPRWTKDVGSQYMLNDLAARDRTAVIGLVLDERRIETMTARRSGVSGADTTITGQRGGQLDYKPLFADEFGSFGVLSDKPDAIASNLVGEIRGQRAPRIDEARLRELRMSA